MDAKADMQKFQSKKLRRVYRQKTLTGTEFTPADKAASEPSRKLEML
jgi:hypothetical protein